MSSPRVEDVYALSPMQQGILFETLLDPAANTYVEQCVITVSGTLESRTFDAALLNVVSRHPALRTSFHWEGLEKAVQVVHLEAQPPVEYEDWRASSPAMRQRSIEDLLARERKKGFDLASAPLLRFTVCRVEDDRFECVLTFQHLVLDRWSRFLFLKELFAEYGRAQNSSGPAAPPPYGEYIDWIQRHDRTASETFWRRQLAGIPSPTPLVASQPRRRPDGGSGPIGVDLSLTFEQGARIEAFTRTARLTLNTLVQGAWAILLSRYTDEEQVLFGATVSGRPPDLAGVESMVGLFINTLPVRVAIEQDEQVLPWLRKLQAALLEIRQYEHTSLVDIQGWSEIPRGTPLFESLVVFENAGGPASLEASGPLRVLAVRSIGGGTSYPLTLFALPGSRVRLKLQADGALFDEDAVARIGGHLVNILEGLVAGADSRLGEIPMLSDRERRQVVEEWNQTDRKYPKKTIAELFEEQVARRPDAEALVVDRERLTYLQLNERANRLASYLRFRGVGPEVLVGLCVERSAAMVVGLLGILKAGGAYVPLDPSYPRPRLELMLKDAGARVVVTSSRAEPSLPAGDYERVRVDADAEAIGRESGENFENGAVPDNLAYVIYTSGSTGLPKGVAIEHHSAVALLGWAGETYSVADLDGVLASTSICFDLSVFELFAPLSAGGKVILAEDALRLPELSAVGEVRLVNTVPSAIAQLVRTGGLPESVATVNLAGEPLSASLVREVIDGVSGRRVFDLYGPTEDTTYSTCARRTPDGPATIGRPISNKRTYILDSRLRPVPAGVPGDLYVAGEGVARGYLHRLELTAERFLSDPFRRGAARMYRTGDRGRHLADGNIEFLGRRDNQVKVRGFRIEIGEIEAALSRHPGVRDCAVVAQEDPSGGKRLVGYVVAQEPTALSVSDLRASLKATLPGYMVPSIFLFLDALPLTPNGKLDRQALPAPDRSGSAGTSFVEPSSPVERTLASIWKEVLGVDRVGAEHDFFELGGHSLLATVLVSRIREAFNVKVPLRAIFEEPALRRQAILVEEAVAAADVAEIAETEQMLAEVRALSDSEARERLLGEKVAKPDDEGPLHL